MLSPGLQPQLTVAHHLSRGTPAWFWQTHFHFCLQSELEGLESWRMHAFTHSYYLLLISTNRPYDLPKPTSPSIHFISFLSSLGHTKWNMGCSGSTAGVPLSNLEEDTEGNVWDQPCVPAPEIVLWVLGWVLGWCSHRWFVWLETCGTYEKPFFLLIHSFFLSFKRLFLWGQKNQDKSRVC